MADWMAEADDAVRAKVRGFVLERDQGGMDSFIMEMAARAFHLADARIVGDLATIFEEEVRSAPHDVQEWWMGECNCDGHLN
jgi:hypothetical protein